jgi:hypothetical protein
MTGIDIALTAYAVFTSVAIYFVVRYNRDLSVDNVHLQGIIDLKCDQAKSLEIIIKETEKKAKMSDDVLAVMNDLKQGGTILEITRLDRNDIFFHNGGLYR